MGGGDEDIEGGLRKFLDTRKPTENRASSVLLYKSNRPQVSMGYKLINHLGCW